MKLGFRIPLAGPTSPGYFPYSSIFTGLWHFASTHTGDRQMSVIFKDLTRQYSRLFWQNLSYSYSRSKLISLRFHRRN